MELAKKKCIPCEGNTPKLKKDEIMNLLKEIKGWKLQNGNKITKNFSFKNFMHAIGFIHEMALLAEDEGHHPDFSVHYNKVDISISTHAIKGLSENDFILAAKIDQLL